MRLIHAADLHLDSAFGALSADRARLRRQESRVLLWGLGLGALGLLFFVAALAQKSMVTNRIHRTGSPLAGVSIDYEPGELRGVRDFFRLVQRVSEEVSDD